MTFDQIVLAFEQGGFCLSGVDAARYQAYRDSLRHHISQPGVDDGVLVPRLPDLDSFIESIPEPMNHHDQISFMRSVLGKFSVREDNMTRRCISDIVTCSLEIGQCLDRSRLAELNWRVLQGRTFLPIMSTLLHPDEYEVDRRGRDPVIVGRGSFGEVVQGRLLSSGESLAIKRITLNSVWAATASVREVATMMHLSHPAVVPLVGWNISPRDQCDICVTIAMKLLSNRDLSKLLHPNSPIQLTDDQKIVILYGVARGMRYAHMFHIIHRDLKPKNIFIDGHFRPYIGDLGGAKVDENGSLSRAVGTYGYLAPDNDSHGCGEALDVFSYGVTAWVVFTRSDPLPNKEIKEGQRPDMSTFPDAKIGEMIQQAWDQDPWHRQTFSAICDFWERHKPETIAEYKEELDKKEAELMLVNNGELIEMLDQLAKARTARNLGRMSKHPFDYFVSVMSQSLKSGSDNLALILALKESWACYKYVNKFFMMGRDRRMTDTALNTDTEIIRSYALHFGLKGLQGIEGPELAVMETYLDQGCEDKVVLYTLCEYWKWNDQAKAQKYFQRWTAI
jgi:hypothetical protein